ncbi:MAG: tetratricopeptide repeat protein [Candidatus Cloacimonetes bacterium]|nr:tetratricopeptide repeat protein [Candidatus Cloacimonadota bacterium]
MKFIKISSFLFILLINIQVISSQSAQLSNTVGLAHFYKGQYSEAFDEFLKALKKDPNNVVSHFNLGRIFEKQGKYKDAFVQYQRTLSLDPNHRSARAGYERLIRYKKKIKLKVKSKDEILEERIDKKDVRSEVAKEELLERRIRQVNELFDQRRYKEARLVLERTIRYNPDSGDLYFHLGRYFYVVDQFTASIQKLKKALALGTQEEDVAHYLIGLDYEQLGDYNKSKNSLQRALELSPSNSVYYEKLGTVLQKFGKNSAAYQQYKEGIRVNPSNVVTRVKLNKISRELSLKTYAEGKLAFERRDYLTAKKLLKKAITFRNLNAEQLEEAQNLLGISEYWSKKNQKVTRIKENQRKKTQNLRLNKTITFEEAVTSRGIYEGQYVSWRGVVIGLKEYSNRFEVIVDTDEENDHQEDLEGHSLVVLNIRGRLPADRRVGYLGTVAFEGKFKKSAYIKNPFNKNYSVRKQPYVEVTDSRFWNPDYGTGPFRVLPQVDYKN